MASLAGTKSASRDPSHLMRNITSPEESVAPIIRSGSRVRSSYHFFFFEAVSPPARVSVQGVESLWGDCRFILADWGSYVVVDLCYFAIFEDFSL